MEQKLAEFRKSKTAEKQVPLYTKVLQGVNTKVNTLLHNNNNKKSDVKLGSTNQQASQNQVLVFCFFIF